MDNSSPEAATSIIKKPEPLSISPPETPGAIVLPIHVTRHVKIYPIQKHELATLQAMSGEKTFWTAVAAGAFVFIIDCLWDWSQKPDDTKLSPRSVAILVVTALVCLFALGKAEMHRRAANRRLEEILSETETG